MNRFVNLFLKEKGNHGAFPFPFTVLLILMVFVFLVTTSKSVQSQMSTPSFQVIVNDRNIPSYGWPLGATVTLTIEDPDTPTSPDYTALQTVIPSPHNPNETQVEFYLPDFVLKTGQIVQLTDGITTKTTTITSLNVNNVDPNNDIVTGTADVGSTVQIDICNDQGCVGRTEIVDINRNWVANFSIPGDDLWEQETFDITPGTSGNAHQIDDDNDQTQFNFSVPNPRLEAQPENDWVNGWQWGDGVTVNLSIDDPATLDNPDYTDSQIAYVPDWDPNQTVAEFNLQGFFDLKAGDIVTLTDGKTTKTHTVANLSVSNYDLATDTISGIADPDLLFDIWAHDDCCWNLQVQADVNGNWTADFTQFGYDLHPGSDGAIGWNDEDGDNTWVGWHVNNPSFAVRPNEDNVNGWEWQANDQVTITLDSGPSFTAPTDEWGNFDLHLDGAYDIVPGTYVEVTDGVSVKDHTVTGLTITAVDVDTDVVAGTAVPGGQVQVWTDCNEFGCANRWETADVNGNWSADFSVPGDEPGEEQTADIQPGSWVDSGEWDDDGDNTNFGYHVPNPSFAVRPNEDNVNGWEWQANDQVTITLDSGPSFTAPTDEWGNFDLHLDGAYDIVPGTYVEVTDGIVVKDHTVTSLTITAVDIDTDVVTGTAVPGDQVQVWTDCDEFGCVNRSTSADENGDWVVDFSVPGGEGEEQTADIQPGSWVDSGEWDDDGDNTNVGFNVPNPTFAVYLFDAQVEGWEWPLGADVTMTIDDPGTPQSPDYSDTQTVVVADWDPNQTDVWFDFNYVYFIAPGHIVTLSDGVTTKTHTVIDLGITDVNEDMDTIAGTAVPDTQVDAWICDEWGCANRHIMADPAGNWLADFANPGPQGDEQDTYDIVPGTRGDVSQSDDDGDSTQIWWDVSNPRLEVSYEHNWIQISGFTPDGQVTYTIYDYEGGHALFGPVTGPVDPHGNGWISQNLFHTDLVPGMFVTAVDETTGEEISLLIQDVNLDYVGIDDDRAFGTAVPNTTIELNISETHDSGFQLTVPVDSNGYWEADLAAAGYPINEYRHAGARLYDAEGDNIFAQPPRLHAEVRTDSISVDNFSKNADVTFTLYDSPGGNILYGPEILHTDSSGNAWVNLWELGIDLQVGHTFVAYDHALGFTKTLEIEPFTFDEMNTAVDTVRGTSSPGEWVELHVESPFSNWGLEALTGVDSQWFADYASDGYDITEQMWAYGWAIDNQSNWSEDHITGLPNIEASTSDDWISGWNFTPDRPVHVQIFDTEGGSLLADFDTMAGGDTQFHADYWQHGVDLQAGMYLLVTDTETGKAASLTLAYLTFDAVDYDADTAVGQADPGTQVVVSADWLFDHVETTVTADPSGNWLADFAALGADLTPDWGLQAKVYDTELDATVANAPQPPRFTASLNEDWVSGENWTSSSIVQISVYEFDGGPLILPPLDWETDPQGNFHANLWEQEVDLQPGFYIVVYDTASGQEKALTLSELSIEFVDYDQDTVGGMAPPDTRLTVNFGNEGGDFGFDLFSEGDGSWLADFGIHNFDLQPGMWGNARIVDDDGDASQVDANTANPYLAIIKNTNIHGGDWPAGAAVTMTIDDPGTPESPDYEETGIVYEEQPGDTWIEFGIPEQFEDQTGLIITFTDGQTTKTHVVTRLEITGVDINSDLVFGIAEPYDTIQIDLFGDGPPLESMDVQVDENGDWEADFSSLMDITDDNWLMAHESDEDGDGTIFIFDLPKPPFPCEPGDTVSGRVTLADGTTPPTSAAVTFEDFYTGETLFFVEADMNGYYNCYLPAGDYRIWAVGDMYSREYYEETIFEEATLVPVTEGAQFTDINFTLDTPFFVWEHLTFNLDDPVTSDIAVRQAIAFGSDRAAMIAAAFPDSPILDSYLPPDHWAYTGEGLMQYDFNPDLARAILEQAGWVDEDGDGIRERDGQRLHILYVTTDAEHRVEITNIFVANMAAIGVEVEVWADPNPWGRIFDEHDFSVAQFAWANDLNGEFGGDVPSNIYICGEYLNAGSYCNPTADQMLNLLQLFGTRAEIIPYLSQHQQIVMADLAVLPLMLRVEEESSPLSAFVALGQEGIYLKHGATVVSGDVGANVAADGPYLNDDSEVVIGTHVTFLNASSRLMGDSVRVKEDAEVYDVYANNLDLDGDASLLGTYYSPLNLPIVPAFPEVPDFTPSTQEIEVKKGDALILEAGSYGSLAVDKDATIIFTGGVYNFTDWEIKKSANLFFEAPSEIRIAGKVKVDKGSYIGPASDAEGVGAPDIVIYVLGTNGKNGHLEASPKAAVFGLDSKIFANIYVPNGTLHIRQGSEATGAFLGKWVLIGNDVTLILDSGW